MSIGALAAIFGSSFLVSLTGALSPGPLTTLAVREGVRRGFWAGPLMALGHGIVELALVVGLALGLNRLLDNDAVAASIGLVGGLFLLWLGWQAIRTAPPEEIATDGKPASTGPRVAVAVGEAPTASTGVSALSIRTAGALAALGAAASVANPFWVVWWATIGAAYVLTALDQGAAGVASFYSAHFLTDLGWLSLLAFALATGRRIISDRVYRGVMIACGVFLVGLGIWFLRAAVGYVS